MTRPRWKTIRTDGHGLRHVTEDARGVPVYRVKARRDWREWLGEPFPHPFYGTLCTMCQTGPNHAPDCRLQTVMTAQFEATL